MDQEEPIQNERNIKFEDDIRAFHDLADDYQDAVRQTKAARDIASNLHLTEKFKEAELRSTLKKLFSKIQGSYEQGAIDWQEYLEAWTAVTGKDTSELRSKLPLLTPGTPIIDVGYGTTDAYAASGAFELYMDHSPVNIEAIAIIDGYDDDENNLVIKADTFIGEEAILSRYGVLLEPEDHEQGDLLSVDRFTEIYSFRSAIHETGIAVSDEWNKKFRTKLVEAITIATSNRYDHKVRQLCWAVLLDAKVNLDSDTTAIDMLLMSKIVKEDSISFTELGAALDITEKGAASKFLVDKETLTVEEKMQLLGGSLQKALNRQRELLGN